MDGREVASDSSAFLLHDRRKVLLDEAHARPFHPARAPQRFIHFAFTTDAVEAGDDRRALVEFCEGRGISAPHAGSKHHRIVTADFSVRWEQHTEFTTYTFECADLELREQAPQARTLMHRTFRQPGPLLVAVDLRLTKDVDIDLAAFNEASLALAYLDRRRAVAATDFCPDADGFVCMSVADQGLSSIHAGALVQRLLELETYRMFALLGLMEAQRLRPEVEAIEVQLTEVAQAMTAERSLAHDHDLLQRLTALAAKLEAGATTSLYRFAASRAYAEIVQGRLEAIQEEAHPSHPTFSGFMSRRLAPAMRTCTTMEDRQRDLSRRLAQATELLRTRVDVELEHQNRNLLSSVDTRMQLQLRLQHTVEPLSMVAATYYLVGLAGHLAAMAPRVGIAVDKEIAMAASIPLVVLAVTAFLVRRLRRAGRQSSSGVRPEGSLVRTDSP